MKINKVITVTLDSEDVEKAIKDYIVKSDDSLSSIKVSVTETDGVFKIAITQDAVDVPAVKVEEPETTVSDDDSVEKDLGSTEEETDTASDDNPFGL
jgi:hypothetical protein